MVVLAEIWELVSSGVRFSLQDGCRYGHKHPGRTNAFAISLLSLLLEEIINFGGALGRSKAAVCMRIPLQPIRTRSSQCGSVYFHRGTYYPLK